MLEYLTIHCPYCGERIELTLDCSAGEQAYVEDCQVCCQPMNVAVSMDEPGASPKVSVTRDDD